MADKTTWKVAKFINKAWLIVSIAMILGLFAVAGALANIYHLSGAVKDSRYVAIYGCVVAIVSVFWLLTPVASRAFSDYATYFLIGGALLALLGLVIAVLALTLDPNFGGWPDIGIALGAAIVFALAFVLSFGFFGPWRKSTGHLSITKWLASRLSDDDKHQLRQELNNLASTDKR